MSFDDGAYIVKPPPAFPVITGFPDISQVRKFGESDAFFETITEKINGSLEALKWMKKRPTEAGAFGYENAVLDPDLETQNLLSAPKEKKTIFDEASKGKPLTQQTAKTTFADLAVSTQNLGAVLSKMDQSLSKTLKSMQYMDENLGELDEKWSYHNAYVMSSAGLFFNPDEFFSNGEKSLAKLKGIADEVEDDDDREEYNDKIDSLEGKLGDILKLFGKIIQNNQLHKKFQFKEAVNIASIGVVNIANVSSHRHLVARAEMEKEEARLMERGMQKQEHKRAEEKKLAQIETMKKSMQNKVSNKKEKE